MAVPNALIVGFLLSLVAGGTEGVVESSLQSETGDTAVNVAISVTVPSGHVGDRLTYARFDRGAPETNWTRDPSPQYETGDQSYQVLEIRRSADTTGLWHNVVTVARNFSSVYSQGLPGEKTLHWDVTVTQNVDLATRDILGGRNDAVAKGNTLFVQSVTESQAFLGYGPGRAHQGLFESEAFVKHPLFLHQTRTYSTGDGLPDVARQFLVFQDTSLQYEFNGVGIRDASAQTVVGPAGLVDGRTAIPLETNGCFNIEITDPANIWWWIENQVYLFGRYVPVASRVCFEVTQWLSSEVPYPLLTETRSTIDGGSVHESRDSLAAFEPGDQPIPWEGWRASSYRENDPTMERSPPNQRFPADGASTSFWFPLSAAMRAVANDPTL